MTTPRPRFSEREGIVRRVVRFDDMDTPLRNSLWNFIGGVIPGAESSVSQERAVKAIAIHVLRVPVDEVWHAGGSRTWLWHQFKELSWFEVYDLLEFVVAGASTLSVGLVKREEVEGVANAVLKREYSGFRFIGGQLTRVIDPAEAAEVEAALATAKRSGLAGVHEHITQALDLFGKRPDPDYRNAIKEAISAVVGTVKLIEGVRDGGLDKALEALSRRIEIPGGLKAGLKNLYGYTSSDGGIRHELLEAPNVGEEDARFMIVTCSAAVNWIIAKADRARVLKKLAE